MALYKLGKAFIFDWRGLTVVCKSSASLSFTNEGVTVRNGCTGDWGVQLEGGDKSGSFSFTGDIDFESDGVTTLSGLDLIADMGTIQEVIYGDMTVGEKYLVFDARLDNIEITDERNNALSFSATFAISGDPEVVTVT